MSYEHVREDPIAEAEILALNAEEDDDAEDSRSVALFLDSDANYRWYEGEQDSDIYAPSLLEAFHAAEETWNGFQIVELRGDPVQPGDEIDDKYASDEIDEIQDRIAADEGGEEEDEDELGGLSEVPDDEY